MFRSHFEKKIIKNPFGSINKSVVHAFALFYLFLSLYINNMINKIIIIAKIKVEKVCNKLFC